MQAKCLLDRQSLLLLGVSGGPDSLCLLDALHRLNYRLAVAHFDHCLRPESADEARSVGRMAEERQLKFILGSGDVNGYARQHGSSLEEAARLLRYHFLFEQARLIGAHAVVVAHHADDQVETVLMHLLRGTGLAGLTGMAYRSIQVQWDDRIALVRPLLGVWRTEIDAYLTEHNLHAVHDVSNTQRTYFRNRLRLDMIPTLEQYNPQVKSAVWRMAEILRAEQEVIEQALEKTWAGVFLEQGEGWMRCSARPLLQLPPGLQRAVLRRAVSLLRPDLRDLEFSTIERGLAFITSPSRSCRMDWVAQIDLEMKNEELWLLSRTASPVSKHLPQMTSIAELEVTIPGQAWLANGWRIQADWAALGDGLWVEGGMTASLDADRLVLPLKVRCRQPGDRFEPLGMDGHSQKLSDFMVNLKIPRNARARWPLVVSAGKIVWVAGYRPAHACQITAQTRQVIRLSLRAPDGGQG